MSKLDCEIIRDLLPLYSDNVCSDKTVKTVEEHLDECTACAEELRKIKECPIVPQVDEDMKKAVKNAGKRIKKAKKKTVIETVALVLILVILFGVIGMYRFVLYAAKADHEAFNNVGSFPYSRVCEIVNIDLIDKKDYENDSATLCVGEKYKVENFKDDGMQKLVVNKEKYIHFIEYDYSLKSGISVYMHDIFFPAKPFIKWGLELMGYSPDLSPGYDLSFYEQILEMPEPDVPLFCTPEAYAKALTYYTVKNYMGIGSGYLLVKNEAFYCIGTKLISEARSMYSFDIQSKDNLDKNVRLIFVGYDSQDEVLEILSSLKIK